jgi:hypothetical protein
MLASKTAKSYSNPADGLPFHKKGPEFDRLLALMEAHGPNLQQLYYASICKEDLFFAHFRASTLGQKICHIKKEHTQQEHVGGN